MTLLTAFPDDYGDLVYPFLLPYETYMSRYVYFATSLAWKAMP